MKIFKLFLILILSVKSLYGQYFVQMSGEYSFPILKQQIGNNSVVLSNNRTYDGIYSSYGAGVSPQLFFGYKLKPHFAVELGYSYLISAKHTSSSTYSDWHNPGYSSSSTSTSFATMHRIQTGARFLLVKNKFSFYNSMRVVIGAGGTIYGTSNYTNTDTSSTNYSESASISYGGLSFGFSDVSGIACHFKRIGIFIDANFICQSWAPKKGLQTKNNYNGVDQLSGMPVSYKEWEYVNPGVESSIMADKPSQHLKYYLPFSSFGINFGISYSFGKK
jgi:hypothetical protein